MIQINAADLAFSVFFGTVEKNLSSGRRIPVTLFFTAADVLVCDHRRGTPHCWKAENSPSPSRLSASTPDGVLVATPPFFYGERNHARRSLSLFHRDRRAGTCDRCHSRNRRRALLLSSIGFGVIDWSSEKKGPLVHGRRSQEEATGG